MNLTAEFMVDDAVARLAGVHPSVYEPGLADRRGDIAALMAGKRALIVRNRTKVAKSLLPTDSPLWDGAAAQSFDDVLANSDVISLHVPLTEPTCHMINADRLVQMRRDAVLINAARGGVVDETALSKALRDGQSAGAALDVFETEPLSAAAAAKFDGLPNLILTPHIAGVTTDSNNRVSAMIADLVLKRLA